MGVIANEICIASYLYIFNINKKLKKKINHTNCVCVCVCVCVCACMCACVCVVYVFLIHYYCSTGVIFPQQWRSGSSGCLNSVLFSLPVHPMQLYTYVNERMISFSWKKYTDRLDFQHNFHCFCSAWVFV